MVCQMIVVLRSVAGNYINVEEISLPLMGVVDLLTHIDLFEIHTCFFTHLYTYCRNTNEYEYKYRKMSIDLSNSFSVLNRFFYHLFFLTIRLHLMKSNLSTRTCKAAFFSERQ